MGRSGFSARRKTIISATAQRVVFVGELSRFGSHSAPKPSNSTESLFSTPLASQSKRYSAIQTRWCLYSQRNLLHSIRTGQCLIRNATRSRGKELRRCRNLAVSLFGTRFAPQSKSYRSIETQRDVLHSQRVRALQKQRDFAPEAERYSTVRTGNVFIRNAILRKCLIRNSIYSTVKELQSYTNSTRFTPQSKSYSCLLYTSPSPRDGV